MEVRHYIIEDKYNNTHVMTLSLKIYIVLWVCRDLISSAINPDTEVPVARAVTIVRTVGAA